MWFVPLVKFAVPVALGLFAMACDKIGNPTEKSSGTSGEGQDRFVPKPKLTFTKDEKGAYLVYQELKLAGVDGWQMDRGWDTRKDAGGNGTVEIIELRQTALDYFKKEPDNMAFKKIVEETMPKVSALYFRDGLLVRQKTLSETRKVCSDKETLNYEKAIVFDTNNLKAFARLGSCHQDIKHFLYILTQDINHRPAYVGMAQVLINQEDSGQEELQAAVEALVIANYLDDQDPETFKLLGMTYQKLNQPKAALLANLESLRLDDSQEEILLGFETLVNRVVLKSPRTAEDFYIRSIYYKIKGKPAQSIASLKKALRKDPEYILAHEALVNFYLELGNPQKAMYHQAKSKEILQRQLKALEEKQKKILKKLAPNQLPPMELPPGIPL